MEDLRERVEAVERALTDGNGDLTALAEGAASAERVEELSTEVTSLQEEVAELSAATQALRGYVGNVRSVNEAVEERADAAVAAVESVEERLDRLESTGGPSTDARRSHEPTASNPNGHRQQPAAADGRDSSAACSACGRPADGAAAPDGGRDRGFESAGEPPRSRPTASAAESGAASTRESVAGFDPNGRGGRVTVREEPAEDGLRASGAGRDAADGDEATLVDRMRDLL